jgi:hypothetical protein
MKFSIKKNLGGEAQNKNQILVYFFKKFDIYKITIVIIYTSLISQ